MRTPWCLRVTKNDAETSLLAMALKLVMILLPFLFDDFFPSLSATQSTDVARYLFCTSTLIAIVKSHKMTVFVWVRDSFVDGSSQIVIFLFVIWQWTEQRTLLHLVLTPMDKVERTFVTVQPIDSGKKSILLMPQTELAFVVCGFDARAIHIETETARRCQLELFVVCGFDTRAILIHPEEPGVSAEPNAVWEGLVKREFREHKVEAHRQLFRNGADIGKTVFRLWL